MWSGESTCVLSHFFKRRDSRATLIQGLGAISLKSRQISFHIYPKDRFLWRPINMHWMHDFGPVHGANTDRILQHVFAGSLIRWTTLCKCTSENYVYSAPRMQPRDVYSYAGQQTHDLMIYCNACNSVHPDDMYKVVNKYLYLTKIFPASKTWINCIDPLEWALNTH